MMDLPAYHHGVQIDFSRSGNRMGSCLVERFDGSLRDEYLNVHCFASTRAATARIDV